MAELDLGSLKLPLNTATRSLAILAKRGAGKTYVGAVMAEEFGKNGIPFVIIDPIDVFWGLRFGEDGQSQGMPVVVFGLQHADITLDKSMGRSIAQAIVKENVSCVISTFGLSKNAQKQLITDFAEELLNINNTPRHIFIEEAHELLPQRVWGDGGRVFSAVSNLVVMGRNRGIGVTMINQRAATLNKDVLTQADAIIALRSIGVQDRKALGEYAKSHGVEEDPKFDEFIESLPSLPTGEGWVWSPEFLNKFERIKIRKRSTFHPDREKLGTDFVMPELNQTGVKEFIEHFNANNKKQRAEQPFVKKEAFLIDPRKEYLLPQTKDNLIAELTSQLKNEYESKLLEKDVEIRRLNSVLLSIRNLVGEKEATAPQIITSNLQMWIGKLGADNGRSKILRFLAEKFGLKFTRSQIALATGLSPESVRIYLPFLKKNSLVIEEKGEVRINPEL
jgi:hypothetical protein